MNNEYEIACNVLLSLEQIVRNSDGWEDSAVEAVHNAVQTAIKSMHKRPQGEWIIVKDERWGDNVKCPFCGKELAGTDLNFCCKCGAKLTGSEKMNGGAELYREETCKNKDSCDDYKYWHCVGCNGCKKGDNE